MEELIPHGVIRFNMSIADVGSLTIEEYFNYFDVYWETKKFDVTLMRDAMFNAIANIKRKKNAKFIELFEKEKEIKTVDEAKEEVRAIFGEGANL